MTTELGLENWRQGQTSAERMCLQLLSIEGFENLDPQCALGGRDGRKDILCTKNHWRYIAAAYFPTEKTIKFKEIKDKFEYDLSGVKKNKCDGIVFLTGQKITPGERKELEAMAKAEGSVAIIYHQERLRGVLDSPLGFAARLEHLRIAMQPEEQIAFVLAVRGARERDLEQMIGRVEGKVDRVLASSNNLLAWQAEANQMLTTLSTLGGYKVRPPEGENSKAPGKAAAPSGAGDLVLTTKKMEELHGVLMFESPVGPISGRFRDFNVWIGRADTSREQAAYTPPEGDKVAGLMEELVAIWNKNLEGLIGASADGKIDAITRFHLQLLSVHPFADGNGRLSRYLVQSQAQGLGLTEREVVIRERATYAKAIAGGQAGDISALRALIQQAITGSDESA